MPKSVIAFLMELFSISEKLHEQSFFFTVNNFRSNFIVGY